MGWLVTSDIGLPLVEPLLPQEGLATGGCWGGHPWGPGGKLIPMSAQGGVAGPCPRCSVKCCARAV